MKRLLFLLLMAGGRASAQELFVFTEPASNMATRSLGVRLDNSFYNTGAYRLGTELMWGAARRWMVHVYGYASDMYQPAFRAEGGSLYTKYRFYARDAVHRHFRVAAFGKAAWSNDPDSVGAIHPDEIDLGGSNSGVEGGLVATQLLHKLALSASTAYLRRFGPEGPSREAFDYTASAGLLLLPVHYTSYRQTNVNLMCELLGSAALDKRAGFTDLGPALQFIFGSVARLDLGWRTQVAGQMERLSRSSVFVRLEYNFLDAYR